MLATGIKLAPTESCFHSTVLIDFPSECLVYLDVINPLNARLPTKRAS